MEVEINQVLEIDVVNILDENVLYVIFQDQIFNKALFLRTLQLWKYKIPCDVFRSSISSVPLIKSIRILKKISRQRFYGSSSSHPQSRSNKKTLAC